MRLASTRNLPVVAVVLATIGITSLMSESTFADEKPQTHTVIISEFEFSPAVLEVEAGDTVIWVNQDIVPHTATARDGSWDTGFIDSNESKQVLVQANQTLSYHCLYHPGMKAQLRYKQ